MTGMSVARAHHQAPNATSKTVKRLEHPNRRDLLAMLAKRAKVDIAKALTN
jgi:hypothetical protein